MTLKYYGNFSGGKNKKEYTASIIKEYNSKKYVMKIKDSHILNTL